MHTQYSWNQVPKVGINQSTHYTSSFKTAAHLLTGCLWSAASTHPELGCFSAETQSQATIKRNRNHASGLGMRLGAGLGMRLGAGLGMRLGGGLGMKWICVVFSYHDTLLQLQKNNVDSTSTQSCSQASPGWWYHSHHHPGVPYLQWKCFFLSLCTKLLLCTSYWITSGPNVYRSYIVDFLPRACKYVHCTFCSLDAKSKMVAVMQTHRDVSRKLTQVECSRDCNDYCRVHSVHCSSLTAEHVGHTGLRARNFRIHIEQSTYKGEMLSVKGCGHSNKHHT